MEFFLFLIAIAAAWFVLKKIMKGNPSTKGSKSYRDMITAEHKKAELYDQRKAKEETDSDHEEQLESKKLHSKGRSSEDILDDLLTNGIWNFIEVDAELIFKRANFKNKYYLHATHYFPEREEVFGKNESGKIVWVDLHDQKEATHPETGERIPGIKRYLRQNALG